MAVRISVDLAVASLKEVVAECDDLTKQLHERKQERDHLIRQGLEHIPMLRMVKITGLSREHLYRIKTARGQSED